MKLPWRRPRRSKGPPIVVYTRRGCCLCEDAERMVARLATALGFTVALVDVDADPDLDRRYGHRVPVVDIPGGPTLAAPIDEPTLRAALEALR